MPTFQEKLNEQIAYEFAASQQYIAIAVHYDSETLPQLAAHFYQQSLEERNHAMRLVGEGEELGLELVDLANRLPKVAFVDLVGGHGSSHGGSLNFCSRGPSP